MTNHLRGKLPPAVAKYIADFDARQHGNLHLWRQLTWWKLRYHWSGGTLRVCFDVSEL